MTDPLRQTPKNHEPLVHTGDTIVLPGSGDTTSNLSLTAKDKSTEIKCRIPVRTASTCTGTSANQSKDMNAADVPGSCNTTYVLDSKTSPAANADADMSLAAYLPPAEGCAVTHIISDSTVNSESTLKSEEDDITLRASPRPPFSANSSTRNSQCSGVAGNESSLSSGLLAAKTISRSVTPLNSFSISSPANSDSARSLTQPSVNLMEFSSTHSKVTPDVTCTVSQPAPDVDTLVHDAQAIGLTNAAAKNDVVIKESNGAVATNESNAAVVTCGNRNNTELATQLLSVQKANSSDFSFLIPPVVSGCEPLRSSSRADSEPRRSRGDSPAVISNGKSSAISNGVFESERGPFTREVVQGVREAVQGAKEAVQGAKEAVLMLGSAADSLSFRSNSCPPPAAGERTAVRSRPGSSTDLRPVSPIDIARVGELLVWELVC